MALGVPEELYWESTPAELGALLTSIVDLRKQQDRQAALNAGLVAATICNVFRAKGSTAVKPEDFLAKEEPEIEIVTPAEMAHRLRQFAELHNRVQRSKGVIRRKLESPESEA